MNAHTHANMNTNASGDTTTEMRSEPQAAICPGPPGSRSRPEAEIRYPEIVVQLSGIDGNAFAILAAVERALRRAGHGQETAAFSAEATSSDYQHLLQTCMRWVTVR